MNISDEQQKYALLLKAQVQFRDKKENTDFHLLSLKYWLLQRFEQTWIWTKPI